ncbi:MAG: hypothetical protein JWM08_1889 [Candidatus Angelobacter sp.]|jgi:hypothetical protein|nr:hypothetical protein [Candidatus Angelobacter sp.]MCU1332897.1 hypothetical protein [Candidatus Angelobacter sp.]
MKQHFRFDFTFPRNYEVRMLEAAPPVHPIEKLYHYPVELEEGDRSGAYLRVTPQDGPAWVGFFALGFDSDQVVNQVCSTPDPERFCLAVGGYAYLVKASAPAEWQRIEQRPVVDLHVLPQQGLMLFAGFTSITAISNSGLAWTTQRLTWEGLTITEIEEDKLLGHGWDALADKEVPFEVDLKTGKHTGGARP